MPLRLRSGLTILASEPIHSKQTHPPSEQLLDDPMAGEQFNNDTVASQPEDGGKSLTDGTGVEQGGAKPPGEQVEDGVTVGESATELPGSTSPCAARVTAEALTNSQQSDLASDKSTDFPAFLGEPNAEVTFDADCQISIFLAQNLVEDIAPAGTATSDDTSFGDGSQLQPDADHGLLVPDCHAESGDKSACGSASNQSPLSTGVQATELVESDNPEPGEASPEMTSEDIESAIAIPDDKERSVRPDSEIMTSDKDTEKATKSRRNPHRNSAKRSYTDLINNESLWMGKISDDFDGMMELADYVLAMSENVVKRAKTMKKQLIESQKYIRDCGCEEMKVTRRLENL